jgi:hypothetical protein
MKKLLTAEQIKWLSRNVEGKLFRETAVLFNKTFGTAFSAKQIRSCCGFLGIKAGRKIGKELPVGTERIWKSRGEAFIKVSNEHGGRWLIKHHALWEQAHGRIPAGHIVIFLDKNRNNFAIDNLALVSKVEVIHLQNSGLWFNDTEMTRCGLAVVRNNLAIHRRLSKEMGQDEHRKYRHRIYDQKRRKSRKNMRLYSLGQTARGLEATMTNTAKKPLPLSNRKTKGARK